MTDYTELKLRAEALIGLDDIPLAPDVILDLIAENEHLALCAKQWEAAAMQWGGERDQLRAEVAGLKTGYQAYERVNAELKAEVEGLRKDRTDWQAECLKRGFEYVRESDDHYVLADVPEMADLLGALLGVEVRSKENDAYEEANSRLNEQIEGLINTIHRRESTRISAELLEPVAGDQLPAIGSEVLIHLASCDSWVKHTVAGYYAWGDLHGDESLHRLFVRVRDADGYLNARLLKDVRIEAAMDQGEQS